MNIRNLVNCIVKRYQTRNPFNIIREKGVILVQAPLLGVRGFYQYFQRNHIIYINENLPEHEKTFVCAHELGHMLLHKRTNAIYMDTKTLFNINKFEIEANKFAMELLIDDTFLEENKCLTIGQMSRMLGYCEQLIELRFKT